MGWNRRLYVCPFWLRVLLIFFAAFACNWVKLSDMYFSLFFFLSSIIPVKPMLGRCGGGNGVTQSVDPGTNQQNTVRFSKWDILNYTITLISWLFCLIFYISLFDCSIQSASPHPATATKSITQQQSPTSVPHLEAVDPVSTDGAQSWRLLRI